MRRLAPQKRLALLLLVAGVTSCNKPLVELTEVLNYSSCQTLTAGASWVEFEQLASIRGVIMQTPPSPPPQAFLAISKGTQPTPGYAFALSSFGAQDNDLTLQLEWITPAPNTVQAQMLTAPCLVLGIETETQIDQVRIDVDGKAFAVIDYPRVATQP